MLNVEHMIHRERSTTPDTQGRSLGTYVGTGHGADHSGRRRRGPQTSKTSLVDDDPLGSSRGAHFGLYAECRQRSRQAIGVHILTRHLSEPNPCWELRPIPMRSEADRKAAVSSARLSCVVGIGSALLLGRSAMSRVGVNPREHPSNLGDQTRGARATRSQIFRSRFAY